jgi:hypothetical protein
MKTLKIILIFIGSFALMFCLGAFYYVDFNFKNWSSVGRFFTELVALAIAGFAISAVIMFNNDN